MAIKKHWIFLGIGIIIGMMISISINYYKNQKPVTFLKKVSNSNGLMEYPDFDMEELTKYTGNEVRDVLYNELLQRIKDNVVGGRFIEYDKDLCRALIDKCQTKGMQLLKNLYMQYPCDITRRVIVESWADRHRIETIPLVIESIKGETEDYNLSAIDGSLSRMTGEKPYYNYTSDTNEWQKLYGYWSSYIPKYK